MFCLLIAASLAVMSTTDAAGLLRKTASISIIEKKSIFPNGRIVGGESARIETHPHQVSLERMGSHTCGGSIVSERYVVTAGHCVGAPGNPSSSFQKQLTVRAGTSSKGDGGSVHRVTAIIRHANYTINDHGVPINDVALLRLDLPLVYDETRRPVVMFDANERAPAGVKAVITGWGSTGKGGGLPVQLQAVSIPIVSKQICDDAYKSYGGLPVGQICAAYYGEGGKDSCQGDSGGPLTIDGRLAGIVSWGNGCAAPCYPGVYTEVAHFRSWIDEHAELKQ